MLSREGHHPQATHELLAITNGVSCRFDVSNHSKHEILIVNVVLKDNRFCQRRQGHAVSRELFIFDIAKATLFIPARGSDDCRMQASTASMSQAGVGYFNEVQANESHQIVNQIVVDGFVKELLEKLLTMKRLEPRCLVKVFGEWSM